MYSGILFTVNSEVSCAWNVPPVVTEQARIVAACLVLHTFYSIPRCLGESAGVLYLFRLQIDVSFLPRDLRRRDWVRSAREIDLRTDDCCYILR